MPVCQNCGVAYLDGESHDCRQERASRQRKAEPVRARFAPTPTNASSALAGRYRDEYREARFISRLGQNVKVLGAVLGALVAGAGLLGAREVGTLATSVAVGAVLSGVGIAVTFFVIGVAVAAVGQMLMATLDSAVNSSPFLTAEQRIEIMF